MEKLEIRKEGKMKISNEINVILDTVPRKLLYLALFILITLSVTAIILRLNI